VLRKMRFQGNRTDYRYFREPELLSLRKKRRMERCHPGGLPSALERARAASCALQPAESTADIVTLERAPIRIFRSAVKAYGSDPRKFHC
jgi:Asp-tRNA(Asn)/Glu-tRNA(Gln) amidotransferase B subunit